MTDKSVVKQLGELLEPIKKDLGAINKKIGVIDKRLDGHDKSLGEINEKLGEVNKKQNQHTSSLVNIENTIKMYGDMYQINDDNVRKLEKRIDVLEDKGGIEAPPELRLANLT